MSVLFPEIAENGPMTDTQGIDRQLKAIGKELEALRADEAELATLHAGKAGELDALRAEKSRDFSGMAQIEGQRAALDTMLREVRGEIGTLEARARELEGHKITETVFERIGATAAQIRELQDGFHGGLLAFTEQATALLLPLIEQREQWRVAREQVIEDARTLGVNLFRYNNTDAARLAVTRFRSELEARGVDLDALKVNPFGERVEQETQLDEHYRVPFLPEKAPEWDAPFEERVRREAVLFYRDALSAWLQANAAQAKKRQMEENHARALARREAQEQAAQGAEGQA